MAKLYKGIQPKGVKLAQHGQWQLWRKAQENYYPWVNLKLVSVRPQAKANFHLAWSFDEQRFARSADAGLLAEYHLELYEWVASVLNINAEPPLERQEAKTGSSNTQA